MWLDNDCCKKIGIFLGGVLFGTAGIKILSSRDAKNCYVQATAAALRAKETVLDTAQCVQENAEDIVASAQRVNEDRAAAELISDEGTDKETAADIKADEAK
ncbi:MAG TPA: hypothetical protein DCG70_08120 [Lachnoclostridium sp.]|jgi:hypothetical protein|nr:hypothetical protein [Lachnoclostridium sp.]